MAGVIARSLSRTVRKLAQKSTVAKQLSPTTKCYSRIHRAAPLIVSRHIPDIHGKTCRCCVHTQGDQDLSRFLEEKISDEKKETRKVPDITGWKVTQNGTEIKLEKSADKESLTVTLNINEATGDEQNLDADEDGEITTEPPFNIEIRKTTGRVMSLVCAFAPTQYQPKDEDEVGDIFEIVSVSLHDGKPEANTYTMFSETMEGEMYEKLMDLLDERGVDDAMVKAMRDYCSAYDHHLYIDFMDKLREFVEEN